MQIVVSSGGVTNTKAKESQLNEENVRKHNSEMAKQQELSAMQRAQTGQLGQVNFEERL